MEITSILFFILSILAVISASITILHKHPIKSAMALIFHFFMLAGIYLTLVAQFLAIMQIIVYAGAIMVLVLFVIMLLNPSNELMNIKKGLRNLISTVVAGFMLVLITLFISSGSTKEMTFANLSETGGTVESVGAELFTNFLVPIEITGILLLSAIIGAVLLAKKRLT